MCTLGLDGRPLTYYSGVLYEFYRIQRQWWIDASVSKRMGNLRTMISARDPFNTNITRGSYNLDAPPLAFAQPTPGADHLLQLGEEERQGAGYACVV